jgi:hypothetical protein
VFVTIAIGDEHTHACTVVVDLFCQIVEGRKIIVSHTPSAAAPIYCRGQIIVVIVNVIHCQPIRFFLAFYGSTFFQLLTYSTSSPDPSSTVGTWYPPTSNYVS